MKSNDIKAEFKKLGIPVVVRTIPSTRPNKWIDASIRPKILPTGCVFNHSFSEELRRKALAIVYGAEFASKQSTGGNIGMYSITLHASEWAQLFNVSN